MSNSNTEFLTDITMTSPRHKFKRVGLLRAGFQYQDLIAIETLIDFYRHPDRYQWVQIEAEDQSFRSIEDVVACRPDGLYELTQVKFTADPDLEANRLSWHWLTTKTSLGKSLLQKWALTTLHHIQNNTLASARLKTDRIPDETFLASLDNRKVQYASLPERERTLVEEQLGSSSVAKLFFEHFEFHHSLERLDDLEEKLWSRVSSDTDTGGWHTFRFRVQHWSTRSQSPEPDGKIRHFHLRDAFSIERSRPLPQNFAIPKNYIVPDDAFHKSFISEISCSDGVSVLWGSPGRGKSTYLSHCVDSLDHNQVVCIRHHYFLSLSDRSEGRFHYHAIRQSFEHQILEALPGVDVRHVGLGELIEVAASQLNSKNRRLVVVIDGLDHVWREHQDQEDMRALFAALLPVPKNVRLVVGTQKIASQFLPSSLLSALPMENWTELPLMSRDAVFQWLLFQHKSGRLNLKLDDGQDRSEVLHNVADVFFTLSHGLPLHLIYSFENMALSGKPVTANEVSSLPECPDGDIRNYYTLLWEHLKPKAKAMLHVLAGLQFGPPPFAMLDCFGRSGETLEALSELDHLLDRQALEVTPFHGSLFAFLRERDAHSATFTAHAPDVLAWLESSAPEYWRWAWLWITRAQLGDPDDLLHAPTRPWAIDSLAKGYPVEQIIIILNQAEVAAFEAFDLVRFHALRSLSTRVRNGPEYQTHEWSLFLEVAVSLSPDPHVSALLQHSLHQLPSEHIPFVVRNSSSSLRSQTFFAAIAELNHRMSNGNGSYPEQIDETQQAAFTVVAVAAYGGADQREHVESFVKNTDDPESLISRYCRESILSGHFTNILSLSGNLTGPHVDSDVLAALCFEGLRPEPRHTSETHASPAIVCLSLLQRGSANEVSIELDFADLFVEREYYEPGLAYELADKLYTLFFSTLSFTLSGRPATGNPTIPVGAEASWLALAIRKLEKIAVAAGQQWKTVGNWISLATLYKDFDLSPDTPEPFGQSWQFAGVRRALRTIAVDVCTIAVGLQPNNLITESDVRNVVTSPYWSDEVWLDAFTSRRLILHEPTAAQIVVQRIARTLDHSITDFCDRSNIRIKLAMFAYSYQLVDDARKQLTRALDCLLGYGFRKDPYANEILESLDLLAKSGDPHALPTLLDLAGAFEHICDYTDGDETDYFRKSYHALIAQYFPNRVPPCYASLVRNEEWGYAESLLRAVADANWVDSPPGKALLETFICPSEVRALENSRVQVTNEALRITRMRTGRNRSLVEQDRREEEEREKENATHFDTDAPSPREPDPSAYPLARLVDFFKAVSEVRGYKRGPPLIAQWFAHREDVGQAEEVLDALDCLAPGSTQVWHFGAVLDTAFDLALRTRGRSHAFGWLVRAQTEGAGWSRWMSTETEARSRLRHAATLYRERWIEFIRSTARPDFRGDAGRNGLVIGLSRLVFFLLEVGEDELARRYTLEMVRVFKEELSEQPIRMPGWAQ